MKGTEQSGESRYLKKWPSKKSYILIERYKMSYGQLKELKIEIEHLQHLLEHARTRLTRDFEHWYIHVYLETPSTNTESNLIQSISNTSLLDTIQPIERKETEVQKTEIQKVIAKGLTLGHSNHSESSQIENSGRHRSLLQMSKGIKF